MSRNDEEPEISKVIFELASNRRASILFEVQQRSLKMQQIAKNLDMTVTETFRHLQRLTDAKLIEKKPDGAYAITPLGNLASGFLTGFNFVLKNSDYFLEHDLSILPYELVDRIGELSKAEFCVEPISCFNRVRKILADAEKSFWTMAEQVDSTTKDPPKEKMLAGMEFKFIMQKNLAEMWAGSDAKILVGSRFVERIPAALVVSEKEASVVFRTHKGVLDYLGLFGTDEKFCNWCRDLFLYYWERADRWYPTTRF